MEGRLRYDDFLYIFKNHDHLHYLSSTSLLKNGGDSREENIRKDFCERFVSIVINQSYYYNVRYLYCSVSYICTASINQSLLIIAYCTDVAFHTTGTVYLYWICTVFPYRVKVNKRGRHDVGHHWLKCQESAKGRNQAENSREAKTRMLVQGMA